MLNLLDALSPLPDMYDDNFDELQRTTEFYRLKLGQDGTIDADLD